MDLDLSPSGYQSNEQTYTEKKCPDEFTSFLSQSLSSTSCRSFLSSCAMAFCNKTTSPYKSLSPPTHNLSIIVHRENSDQNWNLLHERRTKGHTVFTDNKPPSILVRSGLNVDMSWLRVWWRCGIFISLECITAQHLVQSTTGYMQRHVFNMTT